MARVMISGQWATFADALAIVNHPGHANQKSHGRKGAGVRDVLARAGTTAEISAAAQAEAKRITGRDISFDMAGADPQIAREQAEGILQGLERFPDVSLTRVTTYGKGANRPKDHPRDERIAYTGPDDTGNGFEIAFNNDYAGNPVYYDNISGFTTNTGGRPAGVAGPRGDALHEFGHAAARDRSMVRDLYDHAVERADAAGEPPVTFIQRQLGTYATASMHEFTAEAFADVMMNGSDASELSQSTFALLEQEYSR